jgi:rubrerythrin
LEEDTGMIECVGSYEKAVGEEEFGLPDLTWALRLELAAEEEAAGFYEAQAAAIADPATATALWGLAREKRRHVQESMRLVGQLVGSAEQPAVERITLAQAAWSQAVEAAT